MSDSLERSFCSSCHTALGCSEGRCMGCHPGEGGAGQRNEHGRTGHSQPLTHVEGRQDNWQRWVIRTITRHHRVYILHSRPSKLGEKPTCYEVNSTASGRQGLRSEWYSSPAEQQRSLDPCQPQTLLHARLSPQAGWPGLVGNCMQSWSRGKVACWLWLWDLIPVGYGC